MKNQGPFVWFQLLTKFVRIFDEKDNYVPEMPLEQKNVREKLKKQIGTKIGVIRNEVRQ